MKKIIFLLLFAFNFSMITGQSLWKKTSLSKDKLQARSKQQLPNAYETYSLDVVAFKKQMRTISRKNNTTIKLPSSAGSLQQFTVTESSNLAPQLAAKFPSIKSYQAQGIEDPTAIATISIGTNGIHVMISSGKHDNFYIDPYTKDHKEYIAYRSSESTSSKNFSCSLKESHKQHTSQESQISKRAPNDGILRTYRLALACTGEYAQFHLNDQGISSFDTDARKKAAVLSAMNTTIGRVNTIYERDLSIKLEIVADNDKIIFLDSDTDNFSNDNSVKLLEESQTVCDNQIGNANYDVGHTFSTGGGGLALLGSICKEGLKAQGITGSSIPKGDAYDVDFVSHELGHQFGANHTFNGSTGNCSGTNINIETSVEPGSGTTIMAYAGICDPQNVQPNSDPYFHAISIAQIWNTIRGSGCGTQTNTGNSVPTANAGQDVIIPKSTPFVLTGEATDPDGTNSLTYCWEQIDTGQVTSPPEPTSIAGATFRSLEPNASPKRYFPPLTNVISNTIAKWEVLPEVAREMNFSLLVRDNDTRGGNSARDDIKVTIIDTDPFTVTSQNSNVTWDIGSTQTITWNKGNTDVAPINCPNVRIKLSTDGGQTFPITLTESTPNDGSQEIIVPENTTTQARVLVEAIDNVFYNVNSTNFTINSTEPTFIISNLSSAQAVCNSGADTVDFVFDVNVVNGFSETISFTASNLPNGSIANFSPSTRNKDGKVTLTLSNFSTATAQAYNLGIKATANAISKTIETPTLTIYTNSFSTVNLVSPANESDNINAKPQLSWDTNINVTSYDLEIANDVDFTNIVISATNIATNTYDVEQFLNSNTTYYWRVKPKNGCGEGTFSTINSFTTEIASYCSSTFTKADLVTEYISNVTFANMSNDSGDDHVNGSGDGYQDFTSKEALVALGETYELSVTMNTGGYQDHCYVFIDWNGDARFDIATERYDLKDQYDDVVTVTENITIPENAILGKTRMRVIIEYFETNIPYGQGACDSDHNSEEYGETEDYTIDIRKDLNTIDVVFENFLLGPNPVNYEGSTKSDTVNLSFDAIDENGVVIRLFDLAGNTLQTQEYKNNPKKFYEKISFGNIFSGLYLLQVNNGGEQVTKKLIFK